MRSTSKKVDKRGGARDGAGRETVIGEICERKQISIDPVSAKFLSGLGGGNLSLGIRLAAARLDGNRGWREEPIPQEVVSSLIDMASWEATISLHKYLTVEHLLLSVPRLNTPLSWIVLPDSKARDVMLEKLAKQVAEQMIRSEEDGKLIESVAYKRVVERIRSGISLVKAIEMETEPSLASRCLEQYGFSDIAT